MSSSPGGVSPPAPAANDSGDVATCGSQRQCPKNHRKGNRREAKFEGKCADIKNSVYNVISSKDTFAKTTREIAEYVG
jgi:hypothetical protein